MKIIKVLVKTKAKHESVVTNPDGSISVWVVEPPEKGKANSAVIKAIAQFLNVSPARLVIKNGETSKHKVMILLDQ